MANSGSGPIINDTNRLVEQLRRARAWGWHIHDHRTPGVARDLAKALTGLARDHDPDIYQPWSAARALEREQLLQALDLAGEIARMITKADALQPHLVRAGAAGQ